MGGLTDFARLREMGQNLLRLTLAQLESAGFLIQIAAIVATGLLALWLAVLVRRLSGRFSQLLSANHWFAAIAHIVSDVATPVLWLLLLGTATEAGRDARLPAGLAAAVVSLLAAWVAIRLFSHVVRNPFLSKAIFVTVFTLAALNILGVLGPIETTLNQLGFRYGTTRISALDIIQAVMVLIVLLWVTSFIRHFLERRIFQTQSLTPSLQALLAQLLKLTLPVVAVLIALPVLGVNLTALTVFGGALAVGAGLGLQKAVANLISGLMLLSGGTIRPGDVIAVKDMGGAKTYGRVNSVGARYVSIHTRDGIDYLIPNDNFLSNGVENWTHGDANVRVKAPFGAAYGSDPHRVIALAVEAAAGIPRVLKVPQPVCFLTGFGDSAMHFELRFWIGDPMNGISNVRGECLLRIWDVFQTNGLHMLNPLHDIRIVSMPEGHSPPPAA